MIISIALRNGLRVLPIACMVVLLVALAACDPCAGVARCNVAPHAALGGHIVDERGRGVDGVRIDVVRTSGVTIRADSVSTTTANGGLWRVELDPSSAGEATVDIQVTTPGVASYRVAGVRVPTSERGGESTLLPRWVSVPYFNDIGEIFLRSAIAERAKNTPVEFRRIGGVELLGPAGASPIIRTSTDEIGRVRLFPSQGDAVRATSTGELIGQLTVQLPTGPSVARVRLRATHLYRAPERLILIGVGPSLEYVIEFLSRSRGEPVSGVQVEFQRTGGIAVSEPTFTGTSGPDGRISVRTRPLAAGTLEGRLIIRAPAPATPETLQVRIPTFDEDGGRLFRVIRVGLFFPFFGIVQANVAGLAGVTVDIRRSGGVAISPAEYSVVSREGGVFPIQPIPLAAGDALVDLTFRPPPPFKGYTVRNVRISTADRDTPDRLLWVFDVDRTPTGPPGSIVVP